MPGSIVIGYDPERGGHDALHLGRVLAGALDAKPVVLTALPWPDYLMAKADLEDQLDIRMKGEFEVARDILGTDVETRAVARRSGAEALDECVGEFEAGLVVVGSCHRGSIGRTLAGSTGEALMQGASAAVAIAPSGYSEQELKRIAVAFDGSPEASSALHAAIAIARRTKAELTVLTVADFLHYGYSTAWSVFTTGEIEDAERKQKRRLMEGAVEEIPADVASTGRLLVGMAGPELADASSDFDLIVTGSRGYGPWHRTLLGSTSRQLVSGARCPVLVLPRGAGPNPLGIAAETTE